MSRRFMRFAYMPKKEFFICPWDKYKKIKKLGCFFKAALPGSAFKKTGRALHERPGNAVL